MSDRRTQGLKAVKILSIPQGWESLKKIFQTMGKQNIKYQGVHNLVQLKKFDTNYQLCFRYRFYFILLKFILLKTGN